MPDQDRRGVGRWSDGIPELSDRVRPTYPDQSFADPAATAIMTELVRR